jgi:hypothetical protein
MAKADYDSIVNFITTSGLLNIDLNYCNLQPKEGLIESTDGGCSIRYVVETTKRNYDFVIKSSEVFTLPDMVNELDKLFIRITDRYKINTKIK